MYNENWLVTSTSRGRGKPKKTWIEKVKKELKVPNLTDKIALDRTEWKYILHVPDSN